MYDGISTDYAEQMHEAVNRYTIKGTVGSVAFTAENVLEGSVKITNQASDTTDFSLGAVYIGQLDITFLHNLNVDRYSWTGKTISIELGMRVGNSYEYVPVQPFFVSEAKYTAAGMVIKAYDAMSLLDSTPALTTTYGTAYSLLSMVGTLTGVTIGSTEEEIEAMPNGTRTLYLDSMDDVETYRDLVFWIAQTLAGFATINRDGELEIRQYGGDAVDSYPAAERFEGGTFGDYTTSYTGIYLTYGTTSEYYSVDDDTGATLSLGRNPFLQQIRSIRRAMAAEIVDAVANNINFVPCKITVSNGAPLDLGDTISLTAGGLVDTALPMAVMKFTYSMNNGTVIESFGKTPEAQAASKTDKNLIGLMSQVDSGTLRYYQYTNSDDITVGESDVNLCRLKIASTTTTRVVIHLSINLTAADNDSNDLTEATVTYVVNGTEQSLHPAETYIDGKHVLHLMYVLVITGEAVTYFVARMCAASGTITIASGELTALAEGLGLVGDGEWDGTLDFEELVEQITITDESAASATDTVTISTLTPVTITGTETVEGITMSEAVEEVTDSMSLDDWIIELTWAEASAFSWATAYEEYIWGQNTEDE